MFFVVYFLEPQVNVVVPIEWVYNFDEQLVKFVRVSLNSNQTHRVFYTEKPEAYTNQDHPLSDYVNMSFELDADLFPDEGCYKGKLIKMFGELEKEYF